MTSDTTTKPERGGQLAEHATQSKTAGGSGQDDPGEDDNNRSYNENHTSDSDKCNDRSTDPSPSCGWRGVCHELHVKPGR